MGGLERGDGRNRAHASGAAELGAADLRAGRTASGRRPRRLRSAASRFCCSGFQTRPTPGTVYRARVRVVLDTNILVAAGFKGSSASARIVEAVRDERLTLVWDRRTRSETEHIVGKIPPLRGLDLSDLYRPEGEHRGPTDPGAYGFIEDPADRPFAALAAAGGAVLVTNDDHLLSVAERLDCPVRTPGAFADEHLGRAGA